ncbi:unannotated protein [freshwater metagenome]|uniref:Unannotated protein n=1 Tax=freshwater metagenome TaxID=449393 RepID=A0A6J6E4J5_9ZZZZ
MLIGDRNRCISSEWWPSRYEFVEDATECVEVTPCVRATSRRLLWSEILRSPDHVPGIGHRRALIKRSSDTKIHHLHITGVGDHDVSWLDIAVDDALLMGVIEGLEDPSCYRDDSFEIHPLSALDDLAQGLSTDVFHDDIGSPAPTGVLFLT